MCGPAAAVAEGDNGVVSDAPPSSNNGAAQEEGAGGKEKRERGGVDAHDTRDMLISSNFLCHYVAFPDMMDCRCQAASIQASRRQWDACTRRIQSGNSAGESA